MLHGDPMESGDAHLAETASQKLVVQWLWDVHGPPVWYFGAGVCSWNHHGKGPDRNGVATCLAVLLRRLR